MSKISASLLVEPENGELFLCSNANKGEDFHLLDDPLVCTGCQRLICRNCMFSCKKCPVCERLFETPNGNLPEMLKFMLNSLLLRCENRKNGCFAEIPYEKYRSHCKTCKFQGNVVKIEETPAFSREIPGKNLENAEKIGGFVEKKPIFDRNANFPNTLAHKTSNPYVFKPVEPPPNPNKTAVQPDFFFENCRKNSEESLSFSQLKAQITNGVLQCENQEDLRRLLDFYHESLNKPQKNPVFPPINPAISQENSEKSEENEKNGENSSEKSGSSHKSRENAEKSYFQSLPDRVLRNFQQSDFGYLQAEDLKVLLERRNLLKIGNKEELIQRLREYLSRKPARNRSSLPKAQHKIKKTLSKDEKLRLFQTILKEFE